MKANAINLCLVNIVDARHVLAIFTTVNSKNSTLTESGDMHDRLESENIFIGTVYFHEVNSDKTKEFIKMLLIPK